MHFTLKRLAAAAATALAATLIAATPAQAVPVSYVGSLAPSGSVTDFATPDSGPFADASGWRFWTFNATFGQSVSIVVQRLVAALDPVIGVWFGQETDTDNYFGSMTTDSLFTTNVGFGDDELPANVAGGPAGDALVSFIAPASGTYVLAVADSTFTPTQISQLGYRVSLSVPEPGSLALIGIAAFGALALRRRA